MNIRTIQPRIQIKQIKTKIKKKYFFFIYLKLYRKINLMINKIVKNLMIILLLQKQNKIRMDLLIIHLRIQINQIKLKIKK